MKLAINNIVLKILGLLLLTGAVLKGYELLTTPMANTDIWSNRYFLIFVVEFELSLGIWLLSGLFKRAAWIVTLGCFSLFCCITLYKGITGAASCGCFGNVHVNPWITLFAIDIPSILGLMIFRPVLFTKKQESIAAFVRNVFVPFPSMYYLITIFSISLIILTTTGYVLALNKPAKVTGGYEVLEPETWIGKKLPILEHIDIREQLETGDWQILLYHYDCPNCMEAILEIEKKVENLMDNSNFLQVALVELPPYDIKRTYNSSSCIHGHLSATKEWIVVTPMKISIKDSIVAKVSMGT